MMGDIFTLIITLILVYLHNSKKINNIEVLLFAYASQTFHLSIGLTITSFFLVVVYLGTQEIIFILKNGIKVRKALFPFVVLPIVSYALFLIIYVTQDIKIEIESNESFKLILNPIYYFLKFHVPFLLVANRLSRDEKMTLENFLNTVKKIAVFSIYLGFFQFLLHLILNNPLLDQIIGLKLKYRIGFIRSINFIRINALFYEPKGLGIFMALAFPILIKYKMKIYAALSVIIGLLTVSNLYQIGLVIGFICFGIFVNIKSIRIAFTKVFLIIISFFIVFQLLIVNIDIESFRNNDLIYYSLNRIKQRYNSNNPMSGNLVLGIPLQADLEGPVYNFLKDNPILFLSGYGAFNGIFIPNKYFEGTYAYYSRVDGNHKGHLDMGLAFWLFEFGLLSLIYLLIILTKNRKGFSVFLKKYYVFLLIFSVFFRIDYILVIVYLLKEDNPENYIKDKI